MRDASRTRARKAKGKERKKRKCRAKATKSESYADRRHYKGTRPGGDTARADSGLKATKSGGVDGTNRTALGTQAKTKRTQTRHAYETNMPSPPHAPPGHPTPATPARGPGPGDHPAEKPTSSKAQSAAAQERPTRQPRSAPECDQPQRKDPRPERLVQPVPTGSPPASRVRPS